MTLEEAKQLTPGQTLYEANNKKWTVLGHVQTWDKYPDRIVLTVRHGMYTAKVTEETIPYLYINEEDV